MFDSKFLHFLVIIVILDTLYYLQRAFVRVSFKVQYVTRLHKVD